MRNFDTIVVGVGGMGSATVYHLAKKGHKVLGLETHGIPHNKGSSHGSTRIIRLCYYEHPSYVPLLQRAYELWRDLEKKAQEPLLHITGSIDAGPPGSEVFEGSRKSCEIFDLPHEVLTSSELSRRFPGYRLPPETLAVLQPEGGFLRPERTIVQHVVLAQALGAEVHGHEKVLDWEPTSNGVRVRTDRETYIAESLVLTAGAWTGQLIKSLAPLAVPERQVIAWFQPFALQKFQPENFPVFNLRVDEGRFYGFPVYEVPGFKIGKWHHREERINPDSLGSETDLSDEKVLRSCVEKYFPDAAGPTMSMAPCLFTNTPDEHFILDVHPEHSRVFIASPCSGHGFKFCSVVGEIMADLVHQGDTSHDISMHRLKRFSN